MTIESLSRESSRNTFLYRTDFLLSRKGSRDCEYPSRKIDYVIALMTLHRSRFSNEIFTLIA